MLLSCFRKMMSDSVTLELLLTWKMNGRSSVFWWTLPLMYWNRRSTAFSSADFSGDSRNSDIFLSVSSQRNVSASTNQDQVVNPKNIDD